MRWLIRSLIFWAVCTPLFYLFGLPMLMEKLETSSRAENYTVCQQHLADEHLANVPSALLSPQQAEEYCHCVSDGITLTKSDLFDLALKRQPARLTEAMKPVVEACNETLQQALDRALNAGTAPRSTWEPDGTETIHFN